MIEYLWNFYQNEEVIKELNMLAIGMHKSLELGCLGIIFNFFFLTWDIKREVAGPYACALFL